MPKHKDLKIRGFAPGLALAVAIFAGCDGTVSELEGFPELLGPFDGPVQDGGQAVADGGSAVDSGSDAGGPIGPVDAGTGDAGSPVDAGGTVDAGPPPVIDA